MRCQCEVIEHHITGKHSGAGPSTGGFLERQQKSLGRCVFKAFSGRDNHLCTVSFDTDKKRKRREILGAQEGSGRDICQCDALEPHITRELRGAVPFAGGCLELYKKAWSVLCSKAFSDQV